MAKIYTPVKGYNGISASVTFKEGVGETSDAHLLEWFRAHGYTVVEDIPEEKPAKPKRRTARKKKDE